MTKKMCKLSGKQNNELITTSKRAIRFIIADKWNYGDEEKRKIKYLRCDLL